MTAHIAIVFAVFALGITATNAADFAAAQSKIAAAQYQDGIADLEALVAVGDRDAMALLGSLYHRGEGVERNTETALELYRRAAQAGSAEAQFNLGNMFLLGEGVQADESWALTYYRQAAQQGHELALRNMNEIYRSAGIEPPAIEINASEELSEPNIEEIEPVTPPQLVTVTDEEVMAAEPLAAEAARPSTPSVSAEVPTTEQSVPAPTETPVAPKSLVASEDAAPVEPPTVDSDEAQAIKLAQAAGIAVDPGDDPEAQALLEASTPLATALGQIARDEPQGINALQEMAGSGDPQAQYELARLMLAGHQVEQDPNSAMGLLQSAADAGHPAAQYDLGNRFLIGDHLEPDEAMAITMFRKAARSGHPQAQERLAGIYAAEGLEAPDLTRPRMTVAPNNEAQPAEAGTAAKLAEQLQPPLSSNAVAPPGEVTAAAASVSEKEIEKPMLAEPSAGVESAMPPTVDPVAVLAETEQANAPVPLPPSEMDVDAPASEARSHGAETAASPSKPDDLSPAIAPAVAAAPTAPPPPGVEYEYAIVEHNDFESPALADVPGQRVEEHTIIAGGALAQQRAPLTIAKEDPAPAVEPEIDTLSPAARDTVAQAMIDEGASSEPRAAGVEDNTEPAMSATAAQVTPTIEEQTAAQERSEAPQPQAATAAVAASAPLSTTMENEGDASEATLAPVEDDKEPATSAPEVPAQPASDPGVAPVAPVAEAYAETIDAAASPVTEALAPEAAPDPEPVEEVEMVSLADAKAALAEGDFHRAAVIFEAFAERGNAEAQANIGYMYAQGEGVERSPARAVQWYEKAATQGDKDAQYNLAVAYAFGEGVAQNDEQAVLWYRRAADQGSAISQYSLGVSYALGEGVAQNDEKAAEYFRQAAEQGYPAAQYNLAYLYRVGKGVAQDNENALRWFREAAKNGNPSAQYSLGYMYRSGRGVEKDMEEAIKWYRAAAEQGHAEARADLATIQGAQ